MTSENDLHYQVKSKDAFLIELPPELTISGDELEGIMSQKERKVEVDERFWFCAKDAGIQRTVITLENNPLHLGKEEQFVFRYLK